MAELKDVSDPAGALATDAVKALDAWKEQKPGQRTHDMEGDRHVLRELGILVASNASLAMAVETAMRAHKVTIAPGSPTRTKPGFGAAPADLMNRSHYPVEAQCQECHEIVRGERFLGPWEHTGRKPGQAR